MVRVVIDKHRRLVSEVTCLANLEINQTLYFCAQIEGDVRYTLERCVYISYMLDRFISIVNKFFFNILDKEQTISGFHEYGKGSL